jgi:hypothetical protein
MVAPMREDISTPDRLDRLEQRLNAIEAKGDANLPIGRIMKFVPLLFLSHLFVGLPTLLISLVVAYGTFVQADATKKMQQAEAWPFISYGTSNVGDDGGKEITLLLQNNGVGPARLGPIEIRYQGKPVSDPADLLQRCCGLKPGQKFQMSTSPAASIVIPAGENTRFLGIRQTPDNAAVWDRFNVERWKLGVRSCYCSVFDECWVIEGAQARPRPVDACPTNWAPYAERRNESGPAR